MATTTTPTLTELRERAAQDLDKLSRELSEIELLAQQARAEAGRYETKRASTAAIPRLLRNGVRLIHPPPAGPFMVVRR